MLAHAHTHPCVLTWYCSPTAKSGMAGSALATMAWRVSPCLELLMHGSGSCLEARQPAGKGRQHGRAARPERGGAACRREHISLTPIYNVPILSCCAPSPKIGHCCQRRGEGARVSLHQKPAPVSTLGTRAKRGRAALTISCNHPASSKSEVEVPRKCGVLKKSLATKQSNHSSSPISRCNTFVHR